MTPEIEKILSACVQDVEWFIKVFEERASEDKSERFQKPLERFQKIRARLELLRNTITLSLLKASAMNDSGFTLPFENELKDIKADLGRALGGIEQVGSGVANTAAQVEDIRKYISSSSLEEIFRALIRAAGSQAPAARPTPAAKKAEPAPAAKKPAAKKPPAKEKAKLPKAVGTKGPSDYTLNRYYVDLEAQSVRYEQVSCEDLEDVLGGAARAFKMLETAPVDDPYDPKALFIMNRGILSGSDFMTGLRTYFHGYSPLKVGASGKPGAFWTTGSGKFGTKLCFLDIDEVVFTGRAKSPTILRVAPSGDGGILAEGRSEGDDFGALPSFHFEDGAPYKGKLAHDKILAMREHYGKDAHFAAIGPAGENYENVRYAAIALSTVNELVSKDNKPRFCGRGGFGGVMGSKNLLGLVADGPDRLMERPKPTPKLKEINMEIARGKGSARFRDKRKANGGGGTWANYEALNPLHAMPEMNFNPTGKDVSHHLWRPAVEEEGTFMVKDEACFRCGIACHKNVYETNGVDKRGRPKAGKFRAKLDFEPLNLLSSNIGIFDMDEACELVELVDLYCMDSISLAVTLSYAMEYNKRHADDGKSIAGGLSYGDYEATRKAIEAIGTGKLPELGQGSKRLSESLDETDYAMHCKGMEFPAYLPQTNPGYPWALAGGHMSMKTYLLLLFERDTSLDYWVDAITNRGPMIMRDDMLGVCKFSALSDDTMCEALAELCDLKVEPQELRDTVMRTYIRGYRIEREQGFSNDDYVMPKAAHDAYPQIELPHFNTPEFFDKVKARVIEAFDTRVKEASY